RRAWIIAEVVVSAHLPSLRLAAIQQYESRFVVGGVAWLTMLTTTAVLLPQLLTTVGSGPHLAEAIRVGIGGLITVSLLTAVLIAFRRGGGREDARRKPPRFPQALIAAFVLAGLLVPAPVGSGPAAPRLGAIA